MRFGRRSEKLDQSERRKGKTMQSLQEDISEPRAQLETTLSRRRKQEQENTEE